MKVLVLWADPSSPNLGVRVLAEGLSELAKSTWGAQTQVDFQDFGPKGARPGFGGRSIVKDIGRSRGPIKGRLREYDVVLDSGAGDSFADIYGLKRLAIMRYAQRTALRLGIPLVLAPQTIGPFNSPLSRALASPSLTNATAVFARDPQSMDAARAFGANPIQSTDVVFELPRPTVTSSRDVIFNVSGLLWNGHGDVDQEAYRAHVRRFIDGAHKAGRSVSVLAHVVDNPTSDNDAPAVNQLAQEFAFVEPLVPADLTEARELIASAKVVVGARMHACLNALSMGIPAIAWAYSRKFAPLMNELGWSHVLDVRDQDLPSKTLGALRDAESDKRVADLSAVSREVLAVTRSRLQTAIPARTPNRSAAR